MARTDLARPWLWIHLPPMKGEMVKSLTDLAGVLLAEAGSRCGVSTTRDLKTITSRVDHEGLSFLTISLPGFAQGFEQSLDQGQVALNHFTGFRFRGGLPRFLGGFLELVFDRSTGTLLDEPSTDAIQSIRQICLMFGKLKRDCTRVRNLRAVRKYIECEQQVRRWGDNVDSNLLAEARHAFLLLFGDACSHVDAQVRQATLVPKHGPGATADRLQGNQKWSQKEWTTRLERVFPCSDYLIPNYRWYKVLGRVRLLEPGQERPVKVTLVPKTLKTPRIIAIEPTCMQYMQQALLSSLVPEIDDTFVSSFVGIVDQLPNREMARIGSTGGLATLDLSEASDRVSNVLVRYLTRPFRHLHDALQASRSRRALVPGKTRPITLAKFASMGSATCFPIEAMVFSTIALIGIARSLNVPVSRKLIHELKGRVRVYGDDIIVPVDTAQSVIDSLEAYGFKVNRSKSFWTGKFRESCGKEFYDGVDVSVVRCREDLPRSRRDARAIVSTASLRNQLYKAGWWATAAWLDDVMGKLIPWPVVPDDCAMLGRHSFLPYEHERVSRHTQSPMIYGARAWSSPPRSPLQDSDALLKFFTMRGHEPLSEDHLEHCGRPRSVHIKIGWNVVA